MWRSVTTLGRNTCGDPVAEPPPPTVPVGDEGPLAQRATLSAIFKPDAANSWSYLAALRWRAAVQSSKCGSLAETTAAWRASRRKFPPMTPCWYFGFEPCARGHL